MEECIVKFTIKPMLNEIIRRLFDKGFEIYKADGSASVILIREPKYSLLCGFLELEIGDSIIFHVKDTLHSEELCNLCRDYFF